jgi:hypothetical protein
MRAAHATISLAAAQISDETLPSLDLRAIRKEVHVMRDRPTTNTLHPLTSMNSKGSLADLRSRGTVAEGALEAEADEDDEEEYEYEEECDCCATAACAGCMLLLHPNDAQWMT